VAHQRKIAVIGLGYVGLPVAIALARSGAVVIGFDVDRKRIRELQASFDRTREVEESDLSHPTLSYVSDPETLRQADFFIVTVPTPIDASRRPDLTAIYGASEMIGHFLKQGDVVVYESTVYPGAVEEDCVPILAQTSGLRCGEDFTVGYSQSASILMTRSIDSKPLLRSLLARMKRHCGLSLMCIVRSSRPASIARPRSRLPRQPKLSRMHSATLTLPS